VSRLFWRVRKIAKRCGRSRAVARIVKIYRTASDEELYWLLKDGQLVRMAE
jgi:hypothetical protein